MRVKLNEKMANTVIKTDTSSLIAGDHDISALLTPQTEKPNHYTYLKEFRVEQCPAFLQHKCNQHRPFVCFHWHFQNQRRRRPVRYDSAKSVRYFLRLKLIHFLTQKARRNIQLFRRCLLSGKDFSGLWPKENPANCICFYLQNYDETTGLCTNGDE